MSRHYSRTEKEKWVAGANNTRRRSPVRIPESDNSTLIEANRLTLIGRITNPAVQKPRAVVNYFPSFWNLDTLVTGRVLGFDRFQFKFETEEALHSVLRKAPYHFKQWMLILQRWEPIVSDSFPCLVPFWVRIHGLPPHHWTSQAIRTIGRELGHITGKDSGIDVTECRIRVQVNGLEPLEMSLPIALHTGEETTVEIEYERLEKHCFNCFSLSHQVSDCPQDKLLGGNQSRPIGINQQKTLLKIEAVKRRANLMREPARRPLSPERRQLPSSGRNSRRWSPTTPISPPLRNCPSSVNHISENEAPTTTLAFSCFTDAAWNADNLTAGLGWFFRSNTDGSTPDKEQASSSSRSHIGSALEAEAWAMLEALSQALSLGYLELQVFSDCQTLVKLLNSEAIHTEVRAVVDDIRALCSLFKHIVFTFIPRSANGKAVSIAKCALGRL